MSDDFYESPLYSEILPNLWQGGTDDDQLVHKGSGRLPTVNDPKEFDVVVSLCAYTLPVGWHVKEYRYAFPDGPAEAAIYEEVEQIADYVHKDWASGKKVLIRCQAGLNRSGLVTALILLREGVPLSKIIELIRDKRGEYALSNNHFMEYLQKRKEKK